MRLRLYRVTGDSMLPDLAAGSYVVTLAHRCQAIRIGDVVVVDHATHGRIIKRVVGVDRHRALLLAGDNETRMPLHKPPAPAPAIQSNSGQSALHNGWCRLLP